MSNLETYVQDATILDRPLGVFAVLFVINLVLTLAHSMQERRGRLWAYFGNIAGVHIPETLGFVGFFILLTLTLWIVGGVAFLAPWFGAGPPFGLSIAAVGALIGARLSDSWYSHIRLHRLGFRPNPGLGTVPLYIIEAAVLGVVFFPGLVSHPIHACAGLLLGGAFFAGVLPGLRKAGDLHILQPAA
jgi:hypothetical protein